MAQVLSPVEGERNMPTVYILLCNNGEYYVGSTADIEKRLNEHQKG